MAVLRVVLALCAGGLVALAVVWVSVPLARRWDRVRSLGMNWYRNSRADARVRRWIRRRTVEQFGQQLGEDLPMLVRCARSGYVPLEIVRFAAQNADGPLVREVFCRAADRFGVGVGLEDALWRAYEQMQHPLFFRFISALQFARQSGGDAAPSLEALGDLVRSQNLLRGELEEESAEARYSALLVAALPVVIACYTYVVHPDMLAPLVTAPAGRMAAAYAAVSWTAGLLYLRRILSTEEGDWL